MENLFPCGCDTAAQGLRYILLDHFRELTIGKS
jgi:hypothetical protein